MAKFMLNDCGPFQVSGTHNRFYLQGSTQMIPRQDGTVALGDLIQSPLAATRGCSAASSQRP